MLNCSERVLDLSSQSFSNYIRIPSNVAQFAMMRLLLVFIFYISSTSSSFTTIRDYTRVGLFRAIAKIAAISSIERRVSIVRAEDRSDFYRKWSYQSPDDFLNYVEVNSRYGNADDVRNSMQRFADSYPMYQLSRKKVDLLQRTLMKVKPNAILEIGTFFGYSALSMAMVMPNNCTLTCIEGNAENAKIAKSILQRGLGKDSEILSRVNIIVGLSSDILRRPDVNDVLYRTSSSRSNFDFVFLDHDKDCYLPDLKTLENKNLLSDECVVVADNVIFPGAPDFLQYVNKPSNSSQASQNAGWSTTIESLPFERIGFETQFNEVNDGVSISFRRL